MINSNKAFLKRKEVMNKESHLWTYDCGQLLSLTSPSSPCTPHLRKQTGQPAAPSLEWTGFSNSASLCAVWELSARHPVSHNRFSSVSVPGCSWLVGTCWRGLPCSPRALDCVSKKSFHTLLVCVYGVISLDYDLSLEFASHI